MEIKNICRSSGDCLFCS